MGRDGIEPPTSGLKVVHPTLSDSERHSGTLRNSLSLRQLSRWLDVCPCALMSDLELVTAPNLHRMTSGLSHFSAFGLVARCKFGAVVYASSSLGAGLLWIWPVTRANWATAYPTSLLWPWPV